jgi:hypothetical protein
MGASRGWSKAQSWLGVAVPVVSLVAAMNFTTTSPISAVDMNSGKKGGSGFIGRQ